MADCAFFESTVNTRAAGADMRRTEEVLNEHTEQAGHIAALYTGL